MRFTMLAMVALVAIGVTGSAPAGDQAAVTASGDYIPCGCGGPKAIYARQYGTVQPPAMQQSAPAESADSGAAPATAASPASETDSGG
jgi:hypothetical protein